MNMKEYVTLALQNCIDTMIDCLYYYHMTEGRPELADFVKRNDKKNIFEYCISCEQELLAKYELLYIIFPKQTIRDIIKTVYGEESDAFFLLGEFSKITNSDIPVPIWTNCEENPRLRKILSKYKTL